MEFHVTLTDAALDRIMRQLAQAPNWPVIVPAGLSRLPGRVEWLVGPAERPSREGGAAAVVLAGDLGRLAELRPSWVAGLARSPGVPAAVLALGQGAAAGQLAGFCRPAAEQLAPLDGVTWIGEGLSRFALRAAAAAPAVAAGPQALPNGAVPAPEVVWSRTRGALTPAVWERVRDLHVCLVGAGRSGSVLAEALVRLGIRRLTLLDPDRVEHHNFGEMLGLGQGWADVGRLKVEALAAALDRQVLFARPTIVPLPETVRSLTALVAIKEADLLITALDNPAAREAAAGLAACYLKPHLDVGSGILQGPDPYLDRRMGLDVRLALPGNCLRCLGGLGRLPRPARPAREARRGADAWQAERAGSLRSLNGTGAYLLLRLLEDFLAGRVRHSAWLHMEFSTQGIPLLEERTLPAMASCPICACCGQGDQGLAELPAMDDG